MSTQAIRAPISAEDKQFNRNKWIFSTSGVGRDLVYQLIATFLLTYIQFGVVLNAAQFAVLYAIIAIGGKIWDGINDPMMGAIIEGSRMKFGKFKPWIIIGAVGCGIVIMAMFNIRLSGWAFVGVMSLLYLLWESTFTMNDIGYWSMLASLSSDTKKRNSVTMLTVLFAGVGAIIAQGIIPMVTTGNMVKGYAVVSIIVALAYMASQLVCGIFVKETPRPQQDGEEKISLKKMWKTIKGNDQVLWMTLSMLFYNIGSTLLIALAANLIFLEISYNGDLYFYIVVAYGVTSVAINVLYAVLSRVMSRKKLQAIAISVAVAGYLLMASIGWFSFLPFNIWIMVVCAIMISAGQSLFYMASIVNMTNCVEYNEYKTGKRNEAVISTLRPFMAKFADALKAGIIVIALIASGIYTMSQSISNLEAQKSMFEEMTLNEKSYYIEFVQEHYALLEGYTVGGDQYNATLDEITTIIEKDPLMSRFKTTAQGIVDVANSSIVITSGSNASSDTIAVLDIDCEIHFVDGSVFTLFINDSADMAFRDKAAGDLAARITLRCMITIVPILMLIIGLMVQRKKFVIDEKMYDDMLVAIKQNRPSKTSDEA